MLQDDPTLADEVTLMARDHFNKLAALAVRVQGARELGVLAANSAVGERMLPEELAIEKMAAAWAQKSAASLTASAFGKGFRIENGKFRRMTPEEIQEHLRQADEATTAPLSLGLYPGVRAGYKPAEMPKKGSADLEKLGAAAYLELGNEHMEKLAAAVLSGEVSWDELTDMEKLAVGWMGKALGGLKRGVEFFTKGRMPKLPGTGGVPSTPGAGATGGFGQKLRQGWESITGKGRTVTEAPSSGAGAVDKYRREATKLRRTDPGGGARKFDAPEGGGGPYRTPEAPPPPPAPAVTRSTASQASDLTPGSAKKRPWYRPSLKTQLVLGAGAAGATYLGGKGLEATSAFLTPQPPGTAHQYGGAAPSHFMYPQMGM